MDKLYRLRDRLKDVLVNDWAEQIMRKPSIGLGDIEMLHKLTDTIKNIDKIYRLEGGGYDGAVDSDGYSHANRGEHYVRGHYSRDDGGMDGYSARRRGGYSRDDGRTEMMAYLERALESASEQDRDDLRDFMRRMERA